uniref:Uncharacterized protein n=1 Tax=Castor canadensis TaxID=51338 RepID=A0A8C0WXR2_CASCN
MATVRASLRHALLLLLAVVGVAEVAGGLAPGSAGALCCNHSKDNQMCRDVCEQVSLIIIVEAISYVTAY